MAVDLAIVLNLPVYVLDIKTEQWHIYNYTLKKFVVFNGIPPLTRKFTAVGSRDIENYNIKDKFTGEWVPRKQFVGQDKATVWLL